MKAWAYPALEVPFQNGSPLSLFPTRLHCISPSNLRSLMLLLSLQLRDLCPYASIQGLIRPSPPHSRRDQSDRYFLNMVNPRAYLQRLMGSLIQSSTSRSEATLEVTFEGTFKFSFDVRRMEDVSSFF